jgi:uncharacterized membrane protein YeaQ/YmgE (transglycosylase-associated protein family)
LVGGNAVTVTGIVTAIIIGLIVGALGRLVVPGRQSMPIWLTIVVGIIAAFIGTAIAKAIGISTNTPGVDWGELLCQVIVAAIAVAIVAAVGSRRRAL